MDLLLTPNRHRLRHLLGSWTLRAKPGAPGPDTGLLHENIAALENALGAAQMADVLADNFAQALDILEPLQRQLRSDARKGKPYNRTELRRLSDTVAEAVAALKDKL